MSVCKALALNNVDSIPVSLTSESGCDKSGLQIIGSMSARSGICMMGHCVAGLVACFDIGFGRGITMVIIYEGYRGGLRHQFYFEK